MLRPVEGSFPLSPLGLDPGLLGPLIDTLIGAEVGGF
jgi:hypothetical protein